MIYTPRYLQGNVSISRNGQIITSILDIDFGNGLWIYIFPGAISRNDIWVKFKDSNIHYSKVRTPTHIHWAVDILIKKYSNRALADAFLKAMNRRWKKINPLPNRQMQTILNSLVYSRNRRFINRYQALNAAGFFSIEFLTHLMELLMLQEKTNNPQAYMFKEVVNELLRYRDLYKILSTAGYRGR